MNSARAQELLKQKMDHMVELNFEVPSDDDATHIGVVAWTLLAQPPTDTETATLLLRYIYQLGREQGRRDDKS